MSAELSIAGLVISTRPRQLIPTMGKAHVFMGGGVDLEPERAGFIAIGRTTTVNFRLDQDGRAREYEVVLDHEPGLDHFIEALRRWEEVDPFMPDGLTELFAAWVEPLVE